MSGWRVAGFDPISHFARTRARAYASNARYTLNPPPATPAGILPNSCSGGYAMTRRSREAVANDRLTQALIRAAAPSQRPRCGDSEVAWMFLDESPQTRAIAATKCTGCPVFEPCDAVGVNQRFGTWAGVDRTRAPGKKLRP
jgi:hypothetical protein